MHIYIISLLSSSSVRPWNSYRENPKFIFSLVNISSFSHINMPNMCSQIANDSLLPRVITSVPSHPGQLNDKLKEDNKVRKMSLGLFTFVRRLILRRPKTKCVYS